MLNSKLLCDISVCLGVEVKSTLKVIAQSDEKSREGQTPTSVTNSLTGVLQTLTLSHSGPRIIKILRRFSIPIIDHIQSLFSPGQEKNLIAKEPLFQKSRSLYPENNTENFEISHR